MTKLDSAVECERVTFTDRQIEIAQGNAEGYEYVVMTGLSHNSVCGYPTIGEAFDALEKDPTDPGDMPPALVKCVLRTRRAGRPVLRSRTPHDGYAEALGKARRLREAQLHLGQAFLGENPNCWWVLVKSNEDCEPEIVTHGNDPIVEMDEAWEEAIRTLGEVPVAIRKKLKGTFFAEVVQRD